LRITPVPEAALRRAVPVAELRAAVGATVVAAVVVALSRQGAVVTFTLIRSDASADNIPSGQSGGASGVLRTTSVVGGAGIDCNTLISGVLVVSVVADAGDDGAETTVADSVDATATVGSLAQINRRGAATPTISNEGSVASAGNLPCSQGCGTDGIGRTASIVGGACIDLSADTSGVGEPSRQTHTSDSWASAAIASSTNATTTIVGQAFVNRGCVGGDSEGCQ
jgi:hypothetical protein